MSRDKESIGGGGWGVGEDCCRPAQLWTLVSVPLPSLGR